jgi:uncharacterized protein YjbI with pentapeptide repeats
LTIGPKNLTKNHHANQGNQGLTGNKDLLEITCGYPVPRKLSSDLDPYAGNEFFGANLSNSNLTGSDFTRAYLVGTNLSGSTLKDVNLNYTDLSSANLRNDHLSQCRSENVFLNDADLLGETLQDLTCLA